MYWRPRCSSQAARPCFLRKPDIMIGTVMAATKPFSINRTATAIGTGIMIAAEIAIETEIGTGIATAAGLIVTMMIAIAETAMAILTDEAALMDVVVMETLANTVIRMA